MNPVPIGSQDPLGMPGSHHILICHPKNGTLNTLQPNKTLFGCVSENVTLVLVTVILMAL